MRKILALAAMLYLTPASAHDWYPPECCGGQDCAEVTDVQEIPQGKLITTKHGTTIFPKDFHIRPSQDGKIHACMLPRDEQKTILIPFCLFYPAGT